MFDVYHADTSPIVNHWPVLFIESNPNLYKIIYIYINALRYIKIFKLGFVMFSGERDLKKWRRKNKDCGKFSGSEIWKLSEFQVFVEFEDSIVIYLYMYMYMYR